MDRFLPINILLGAVCLVAPSALNLKQGRFWEICILGILIGLIGISLISEPIVGLYIAVAVGLLMLGILTFMLGYGCYIAVAYLYNCTFRKLT